MRRIISLVIVITLLCTTVIPVSSAVTDSTVQPRWSYLTTVKAYLDINWLGLATCEGSASIRSQLDVKVVVRLQQLTDSGWSTIKTWTATDAGSAYASGVYAVHSGYTYRVSVTGYVYDDNGNLLETGSTSDTFVY